MQKRVKMLFNQYVETAQVRRADGQWETKYIPLTRQEVENADLYDIQYVDASNNLVPRERILDTFPKPLDGNIAIMKGQQWNHSNDEYVGRQNGVDIYRPKQ